MWSRLGIFRGLPMDMLHEIRAAMTDAVFEPGDRILEQGEYGDEMFLLDRGSVKIRVRGDLANTVFERVLTAPALFGEMALITSEPRSATVHAETRTRCFRINRATFEEVVNRNPQASVFLTKIVGERLMEAGNIRTVGKYEVQGRLGAGAVATVFEAVHPELGQEVALKMLSHALVFHPGFAEQFRTEARLVASLSHPHIVRVLDTAQAYGTHFIVMEKLTGTLLEHIVEQGERLPWGMIRRICKEIALALAYSHSKNLLHRDIKPSNVFLTEDRRVKILDFGIAVSAESSASSSGHLLGTPYYMAPEQILGHQLDGRADLYSLGVMAYELCTFEVPFDAETLDDLLRLHLHTPMPDPRRLQPDIPDDLVQFIEMATAKKPDDRFSSCDEAAAFLQTAAELPLVRKLELSTLAISYHPSRRAVVATALRELHAKLSNTPGISLLYGHQASETMDE
ncbi:MAG: protein kinase [Myxococcales bacterium]|nr:protein kinase [Myxococcales bacterium]